LLICNENKNQNRRASDSKDTYGTEDVGVYVYVYDEAGTSQEDKREEKGAGWILWRPYLLSSIAAP
jgi:hypothetical protein